MTLTDWLIIAALSCIALPALYFDAVSAAEALDERMENEHD
jgi:hypothetical protein